MGIRGRGLAHTGESENMGSSKDKAQPTRVLDASQVVLLEHTVRKCWGNGVGKKK